MIGSVRISTKCTLLCEPSASSVFSSLLRNTSVNSVTLKFGTTWLWGGATHKLKPSLFRPTPVLRNSPCIVPSLNSVIVTETTQSCMENQTLVTDRTWLQLMCCAPLRPHCPSFNRDIEYGDSTRVNLELTVFYICNTMSTLDPLIPNSIALLVLSPTNSVSEFHLWHIASLTKPPSLFLQIWNLCLSLSPNPYWVIIPAYTYLRPPPCIPSCMLSPSLNID